MIDNIFSLKNKSSKIYNNSFYPRIRSFVHRRKKLTNNQQLALDDYWASIGIEFQSKLINLSELFGSDKLLVLDIGFGMDSNLVNMARNNSDQNFLGVETYLPGICNCLIEAKTAEIKNLRLIYHDIVEVLEKMIPDNSIHRLQLFFPDPWPKTCHHKRRIVNLPFINLVTQKLNLYGALFHIITDCEKYAFYIIKIINNTTNYKNRSLKDYNKNDSSPITKFEKRGQILGNKIYELIFEKIK
ncbi:tRNA (guanosine(46)-N7)-methyltransferase TrmB [Candidatus Pantoea edessiphila]|uniref:tRNA (guanine-N(7)-)-methyltransferase n=1 Tax=Candidatus Pantoea edessiphila TaxID=2044610 RepID=A0A2P5SZS4_9GAMM|nr:tRNA (guanosine(46)-N7)-methyltransferase TrmB [Candidatus Pantoea edessiphila]PPI87835.1 tRNA (guanosine(46)-N7)-methyltransferase TrmB [Candidatus Pantoea edessiphila]